MYIDGVIAFSLMIIALTCWIMVYVYLYAKKHIDSDAVRAQKEERREEIRKVLTE